MVWLICTRLFYLVENSLVSLKYMKGHPLLPIVAHRALPDVEAVETLFMLAPLHDILASLAIRTPQQQLHLWALQKQKRQAIQQLLLFFGKKITKAHASQLTKQGITHQTLEKWKGEAKDVKEFAKTLKNHKVNSKKLQDNLCLHYFRKNRPIWSKCTQLLTGLIQAYPDVVFFCFQSSMLPIPGWWWVMAWHCSS